MSAPSQPSPASGGGKLNCRVDLPSPACGGGLGRGLANAIGRSRWQSPSRRAQDRAHRTLLANDSATADPLVARPHRRRVHAVLAYAGDRLVQTLGGIVASEQIAVLVRI